ncbi:MAG: hypothetical protein Kow001_05070 [Acidobacteriota bacterium]
MTGLSSRNPAGNRMATAAFPALLVLAALIPFETREPWLELGPLRFSNLELAVLAVLIVSAASLVSPDRNRGGLRGRLQPLFRQGWTTGVTPPALALAAILLVAALAAPDPPHSLRFWGRFTAGLLVYLSAVLILDTAHRRTAAVGVFAATSVLVAAIVVLEWWGVPGLRHWLERFRESEAFVGGRIRPAGPLGYPTIAAMYLEIALAFVLALIPVAERRSWLGWLPLAAAALVSLAVILTLTRAGLLGAVAVHAAVLLPWLVRRGWDRTARRLAASLATLAVLTAVCAAADPILRLRLLSVPETEWYRAAFEVPETWSLHTGDSAEIPVRVHNHGFAPWKAGGQPPLLVSYHWLDADTGQIEIFDGLRTPLPQDVPPGSELAVRVRVQAPPRPGRFRLAWNVVMEHRFWLSDLTECPSTLVSVTGPALPGPGPAAPPPSPPVSPDRQSLWRAAVQMFVQHPVLGIGPDRFRLDYGPYLGLPAWDSRVHTNNMYLEFLVGSGLVGAAAFVWVWVAALGAFRPLGRLADGDPGFLAAAGGTAAILVHGLLDSFWAFTPTYLAIWLVLALAEGSRVGRLGAP